MGSIFREVFIKYNINSVLVQVWRWYQIAGGRESDETLTLSSVHLRAGLLSRETSASWRNGPTETSWNSMRENPKPFTWERWTVNSSGDLQAEKQFHWKVPGVPGGWGGLAEREPAAEQANSIFDSTYRSRGFICLLNILLFNVIYPNFLTCFCIYKQWAHCLLPFLLLSILRIFASSTLGKFPFFWRVNLYICEICCFISAWEVGISGNWGFFTWNYCPSHRNNNYYSKYLYLKWREKEVFTWC